MFQISAGWWPHAVETCWWVNQYFIKLCFNYLSVYLLFIFQHSGLHKFKFVPNEKIITAVKNRAESSEILNLRIKQGRRKDTGKMSFRRHAIGILHRIQGTYGGHNIFSPQRFSSVCPFFSWHTLSFGLSHLNFHCLTWYNNHSVAWKL
jgi:hypothetical protein